MMYFNYRNLFAHCKWDLLQKTISCIFFRQTGHVDDWVNIPNVLFIQFFIKNKIKVHSEYLPNTSTQSFDEKKNA